MRKTGITGEVIKMYENAGLDVNTIYAKSQLLLCSYRRICCPFFPCFRRTSSTHHRDKSVSRHVLECGSHLYPATLDRDKMHRTLLIFPSKKRAEKIPCPQK